MNTYKLLNKGVGVFKKTSIIMRNWYNCAKTVSHIPRISRVAETPSPQELLNAAKEWKSTHPSNPNLPPFKSVTPPPGRVPEDCRTPTFKEFTRKENRTPEEKQLDEAYGDEHNI